jgi:hypothetical protein
MTRGRPQLARVPAAFLKKAYKWGAGVPSATGLSCPLIQPQSSGNLEDEW